MNPFEHFQKLKPEIEADPEIMQNLRTYAFTGRTEVISFDLLECAGTGANNTHFRIGRIGDVWLATREYMQYTQDQPADEQKQLTEMYIQTLIYASNEGTLVPILCGGVIAREKCGDERYFMVIQDLTSGGRGHCEFKKGSISAMIDSKEVCHDFPDEVLQPGQEYKYMLEDRVILLEE